MRRFGEGAAPVEVEQIADDLELPLTLTHRVLRELTESGIITEVQPVDSNMQGFMPSRDADQLSVSYVLEALERRGVNGIPLPKSRELMVLSEALEELRLTIQQSPANKRLKEI